MTTETTSKDPLSQPFRLKDLKLKNRVMSTRHAISYGVDGKPQERYQLYHEEKAKGGIALTMFGGASNVALDSASVFGQLDVGDDGIIPYFQEFAQRIHRYDCALMCQLTHMGRRTSNLAGHWLPVVAPSRVREDMHRCIPKEMDRHDIARIAAAFGQAARRCKEGGLDGCEVIATGHLVDQFWSPRTNVRSDDFGGSLVNRTRFSRLVFEAMREAVGGDFPIGLRMVMTEDCEDGLTKDDCLAIARLHAEAGLINFLNLVHGRVDTIAGLAAYMPGMAAPLAPFLEMAGEFRRSVGLPVFHATRVTDVATARHALREGLVDMIGMTRGHIADPHIVNKITTGEEDRIRPCIGATYCSTYRQCIHNAATGREAILPHVIAKAPGPALKVVVVGAGPAGLEAARVSAARGHRVLMLEAAERLGGQVLLAAKAPWRGDLLGIVDWLAAEVTHLGAEVRTNCYAETEDVLAEEPNVVIIATGGLPDSGRVPGGAPVLSTWDIFSGTAKPEGSILIYDALGKAEAASCAEKLAAAGQRVELVSPDRQVATDVMRLDAPTYLKRFYELGVTLTPDRQLTAGEPRGNRIRVRLGNVHTGAEETRVVDHLIVEQGTLPNDALYHDLTAQSRNDGVTDLDALVEGRPQDLTFNQAGRFRLYRVGDAVASRDIHAAILDSLRLCHTL